MRDGELAPGYQTQLWALYGLAGGHVLFVLTRAPWGHKFLAFTGALAFALAASEARRLGRATGAGKELMAVTFIGAASQLLPVLLFAGPLSRESVVAMGLAVLCIQGFWALHRYPAPPQATLARRASLAADLREGWIAGLFFAAFFALIAGGIMLVASLSEGAEALRQLTWVVAAYVGAGLVAGTVFGALRPVAAYPLGLVLIGFLGGCAVYGAVVIVMPLLDPEAAPGSLAGQLGVALTCGILVGPPAALGFRDAA